MKLFSAFANLLRMERIFRSDTCEGHYCFISMTTSELVVENTTEVSIDGETNYVGLSRPRYEILAGCLKVDDDQVKFGTFMIDFLKSIKKIFL